ncbi:MAG: hypothetical protein ABIM99_06405 [Candidatus Dojkabacteria bacterium]
MFSNIKNLINSYRETSTQNFKDITFACSFDPLHQIFFDTQLKPLDVLAYIHKELNISKIRLSIRWDKDLDFYKPYLDYCLNNNIKVVLNVGPIKVMRWPEEHIHESYINLINKNDVIDLSHPIAKISLEYLEDLLKALKNTYSKCIITIQTDNELFNKFGKYSLVITREYELEVIKTVNKYFNLPIYINSSGLNDFKKIFDLVSNINNKVVLGINYYYKTKYQNRIPLINKLDNLILRKPFSISPDKLKEIANQNDYAVEISELQGEPWWPNALTPGNSFKEFKFTLGRSLYLKPKCQDKIVVRYWGIEDFVSKFLLKSDNEENRKIKELVIKIQSQSLN